MKVLLFFLGSISLLAANKCAENAPESISEAPMVQLETYGCRGFCPSYKLLFLENGQVCYEGIRHVVKMGHDTIALTKAELRQLKTALKTVNIWQYPERIESGVADAPSSLLVVFDAEKRHQVLGSIDRPKELLEFEALLKELAEAHGLKVKEGVNPYEAPPNQQEILVRFEPDVNPGNFMMQFEEIRLRIVRRVSADNIWIIGYNPDQITEQQLIDTMKAMKGVLEAGPNK